MFKVQLAKMRKKKTVIDDRIVDEFVGHQVQGEDLDPELVMNPVLLHAIEEEKKARAAEAAALKRMGLGVKQAGTCPRPSAGRTRPINAALVPPRDAGRRQGRRSLEARHWLLQGGAHWHSWR